MSAFNVAGLCNELCSHAMPSTTPWSRYVRDVTARAPQHEIAATSGIEPSVLSRWLSGQAARPHVDHAIKFARAYSRPPTEALVAAGYLTPEEAEHTPAAVRPVATYTNEQLVAEIGRYGMERHRLIQEMVARFLGHPVEIEAPPLRNPKTPQRRKVDPGRLHELTDLELFDATTELMDSRLAIVDEFKRRLVEREANTPPRIMVARKEL